MGRENNGIFGGTAGPNVKAKTHPAFKTAHLNLAERNAEQKNEHLDGK